MKKFLIPLLVIVAAPLQAGEIALPDNVTIKIEGDKRIIESDGIPTYNPGTFPRRGNPNPISKQEYRFEMPVNPRSYRGEPDSSFKNRGYMKGGRPPGPPRGGPPPGGGPGERRGPPPGERDPLDFLRLLGEIE